VFFFFFFSYLDFRFRNTGPVHPHPLYIVMGDPSSTQVHAFAQVVSIR